MAAAFYRIGLRTAQSRTQAFKQPDMGIHGFTLGLSQI